MVWRIFRGHNVSRILMAFFVFVTTVRFSRVINFSQFLSNRGIRGKFILAHIRSFAVIKKFNVALNSADGVSHCPVLQCIHLKVNVFYPAVGSVSYAS